MTDQVCKALADDPVQELANRLQHAITTMQNDDVSHPQSEYRQRHIARYETMADVLEFLRTPSPDTGVARITGARNQIEEAACLIWSELCPGLVMGDEDLPHYEAAAKAVLALNSPSAARETIEALQMWLAFAEEELSEFDEEYGKCVGEKLCPKCESSGCIQMKISQTRLAIRSLAAQGTAEGPSAVPGPHHQDGQS